MKGWDVPEFAERLGHDSTHRIYNWLRRGMPSAQHGHVADVLGVTVDELLSGEKGVASDRRRVYRIPMVGIAQLGAEGFWYETEHPTGNGDGYIEWPNNDDPNAYAVKVLGDSMWPRAKSGEIVVVYPNRPVKPGDDVLVITKDGRRMVKELLFQRDGQVTLSSYNPEFGRLSLPLTDIDRMHYVVAFAKADVHKPD